ncbi:MAG: glutamine-hydrolyzing carbamoyl-phosphate synthase small subunit [Rhodospirillaceae bacterium]|jgi:carbamoyl-phosphate synthase small subunit|nr:glutamine-hydrolyzing carbamoyl-phosphate synthase small subunit [Rhodospirillaceae bacterium]MBT4219999.1 glutamine-hydrolyzing carbamoyl-phosphate synthase small subunit [Rhodospirillaceae bacterium]MBT4463293.1 glutamine-hydrolyzing carbamoyl-phosphate synthase small subunit [Rhodospirillaceae bacterium]MBT5308740.1 glutamine-hydrolyzing carbamoyl-phosphate synthase small subunit [Rhodospirillaceae bacterium]MBT6407685.1 glutamine-hydrolyzing carbamoyl-phosphate synthase small subunit [Rh
MSEAETASQPHADTRPPGVDAAVVLEDGSVFWGYGAGVQGVAIGEVCFNTSLTGYQEILSDPSYAGQIITFTFPHIGNVGSNAEDIETVTPAARGCILRADITDPANWRSADHLDNWLKKHNLVAISGIDTRALTRRIRDGGAPKGAIIHLADASESVDIDALSDMSRTWPGLEGMDLAKEVSCSQTYEWDQAAWSIEDGYATQTSPKRHVVAVDFGAKLNILRCLAAAGCRVTVVPGNTSADDILALKPDGVFLSNGPGDPAATGEYAVPMIKTLLDADMPIFGICLGHQMLSLATGATTTKMHMGHRGANHPVKDLETGRVEITSQNHGFVVERDSLPKGVIETHTSLFDGTLEGIRIEGKKAFSVQHHPEASPGPQDSHYLFHRFVEMMD